MKYGFGVDLGGTTVKIAYFDQVGTLLHKWEIPTRTENNGEYILSDIAAAINGYLEENRIRREALLGIGIGVPGPVDRNGIVNECENLGWGVFHVADALTALTGLPVKAGNDATMAALGEYWKGSGRSYRDVALITLGTGVGSGIIIGGRPVYGHTGAAGEVGHMSINPEDPIACNCGKHGCAEQYSSATGIVRTARQYLSRDARDSVLRQSEILTCKDIFDAAAAGDGVAADILEQVYNDLAQLVANVCCVLDPEAIIIGGGVSKAGPVLLNGIRAHLHKHIFHACAHVQLTLAALGNDAGAYGAFKLILDEINR